MDKKGIIAVTLSIIVMVVWQLKFAPKFAPPPPAEQPGEVTYQRTTNQNIQIEKKFTLPSKDKGAEEYLVLLDISFKNTGNDLYRSDGYFVYVGSAVQIHEKDLPTYTTFDWYRDGSA